MATPVLVVLLHGYGQTAELCMRLARPLVRRLNKRDGVRVLALEGTHAARSGDGLSWYAYDADPHKEGGWAADTAPPKSNAEADLLALRAQLDAAAASATEALILVGFSEGGTAAFHFAARFPERLSGVAILSAPYDAALEPPEHVYVHAVVVTSPEDTIVPAAETLRMAKHLLRREPACACGFPAVKMCASRVEHNKGHKVCLRADVRNAIMALTHVDLPGCDHLTVPVRCRTPSRTRCASGTTPGAAGSPPA